MSRNFTIRSHFLAFTLLVLWIGFPTANTRKLVTNFVYVGCNRVSFGVKILLTVLLTWCS
jgi:hypothetical protein